MAHFLAGWGADPTLVLELLTHENEGDDEGSSTKVTVATGGGANLPRHRAVLQRKSLLHLVCSKSYHEILLFLLRLIEFYENLSLAEYYEIVQAEYDELYRAYHGCHAGASSIWEADPVIAEEALVGENESLVEVSHTHSLPSQSCRTQSRSRDRSRFAEQKKKERQAAAEKEAAEKEVQHHQDHVVCCRPILSPWRNAMVSLKMIDEIVLNDDRLSTLHR